MIEINKITLYIEGKMLFNEAELTVFKGNRVAIIGANGCGKTTLFNLIQHKIEVDSGKIRIPSNLVTAHVAQSIPSSEQSAINYVIDGDKEYRELHSKLLQAETENNGKEIAVIHEKLDTIGAYSINARASEILHGLGFDICSHSNSVNSFSGGWRMRLNLAQALICRSDLLLLDEPTNHLDVEAVIWLEGWLKKYQGTLLFISHDREFIDSVSSGIAHIGNGKITFYPGNYSAYEKQKAEKLALQDAMHKKQQREIEHLESFIRRFKAKATKAKQAQSRVKALEKMELIAPAHVDSPFSFSFKEPPRASKPIMKFEDVSFSYGEEENILSKIDLNIFPGDRIGLLGANGAGKSTLIKLIAGEHLPNSGTILPGQNIAIGYFAQHQIDQLDLKSTALDHIQEFDKNVPEQEILNFLGGFAFDKEKATSPIAPFSGGEKARLVLAMIVWQKPNLLLLDEPTNHLDIEMRHALTMALQDFDGAMIIISHDRHLLTTTAETLWVVSNKELNEFSGDISGYYQSLLENQSASKNKTQENNYDSNDENNQNKPKHSASSRKEQRKAEADLRKQLQPLKNKQKKLEETIAKLNNRISEIEAELSSEEIYSDENKTKLKQLIEEQGQLKLDLEEKEMEWFEVLEEIESFEIQ